jgi:hypothetical protein
VNRFCSIFSQLLNLFSRAEFDRAVRQTRAERHARGFTCWEQFVAMLFCQLGRAQSLREICHGLASCEGKLVHLGVTQGAPKRSTLAYANAHRPWELYQQMFFDLLGRCQALPRARKKFRFKNKLLSLDSSVIDLCASVFDWAHFRRTKGAVKLHLLLDHDGYLPRFAVITDGKGADVHVARTLHFEPGTILVIDRGYVDLAWFGRLTAAGVFFVTRPKTGMVLRVVESRAVSERSRVIADEIIEFTSAQGLRDCPYQMRRVTVVREDTLEPFEVLTNNLVLAASTIAAIYKDRWQIELFFKALKQNLKIKTFVGTSANALKIQIWTALIAMLLLKYLQLRSAFAWSLSNLTALLRMNLFVHRDLLTWIDKPFTDPPDLPQFASQLTLFASAA